MKIRVDKDNLRIIELSQLESGEVKVTEVEFIFTPEYEDLIKTAVFTLGDKSYKVILQNDKCFVPSEVLVEGNKITIGVYAFKQDSEELILRYSPVPVTAEILEGSYVEEAENTSHPTPTEIEQLMELISKNTSDIESLDERVETLEQDKDKCCSDIDSIKDDIFDIKADIQDIEDNITSINNSINDIEDDIDDIEGDISDIQEVDIRQDRRINSNTSGITNLYSLVNQFPKNSGTGSTINLGETYNWNLFFDKENDKYIMGLGDTSQESTTGKNVCPTGTTFSEVLRNYWYSLNGENAGTLQQVQALQYIQLKADTKYVWSMHEYENIDTFQVLYIGSDNNLHTYINTTSLTRGLFTTNSTDLNVYIRVRAVTNDTNTKCIAQLEEGQSVTPYEKYTGGIPAPNPSYPEPISVVTGTQTINIKNGNDEVVDTVTLHLGTNEFCKIGDYADELLLDLENDKVYKKKAIGKEVLNGSEDWQLRNTSTLGTLTYSLQNPFNYKYLGQPGLIYGFCNYFKELECVTGAAKMWDINEHLDKIGFSFYENPASTTSKIIYINTNSNLITFLQNNEVYIYYILNTATYEEIEDDTLKEDLYNLYASQSIEGTTIIETSGNLPIRLKVSALSQLS